MCQKLVEAQDQIRTVQCLYYWLPLPFAIGPEGGSGVADPILSTRLPPYGNNSSFVTALDLNIINFTLKQAGDNFNIQSAPLDGTPYLSANFDYIPSFDSGTTSGFGNLTLDQLNAALKIRSYKMNIANTALQTIEIIMGEWSGLGLCDIIATMA